MIWISRNSSRAIVIRGALAHRETGKFPGGSLPNYKILKLQISANSFDTKRVTCNVNVSGMPCFRYYLIPPVGSNKAPILTALVADYRRLPQRCTWSPPKIDNPQTEYFCLLLEVLSVIKSSTMFESKATFEASVLLEKWRRFDTLLTAFLMLRVFNILRYAFEQPIYRQQGWTFWAHGIW